eukprot:3308453-Pleurochrysis_carterae.AAC.3
MLRWAKPGRSDDVAGDARVLLDGTRLHLEAEVGRRVATKLRARPAQLALEQPLSRCVAPGVARRCKFGGGDLEGGAHCEPCAMLRLLQVGGIDLHTGASRP